MRRFSSENNWQKSPVVDQKATVKYFPSQSAEISSSQPDTNQFNVFDTLAEPSERSVSSETLKEKVVVDLVVEAPPNSGLVSSIYLANA